MTQSTAERSSRKSPPEAFSRPGGYEAIGSALERGFELYLAQMSPEEKSNPFVEAGLRSVKQHLEESRAHATPRNTAYDI